MFEIEISDPEYEAKMRVLNALSEVKDPELGVNIVDLGMVYNIEINDNSIILSMTLSTPSCPMSGMIVSHTRIAIEQIVPEFDVDIRLVWTPKWSYELISDTGRVALGI